MKNQIMQRPAFGLLLASVLLLAPLAARAQETQASPENYAACTALVESDASAALGMAKTLKARGGEAEAGGTHCEALALMKLGRAAEAGDAWALAGEFNPAIRAYDNAIARTPDSAIFYEGRARVKALAEKWEGARDDAAEALAIEPNFPAALLIRAAANRILGYPRAALVDANNAVSLNPHNLGALLERGLVHKALGDIPAARADWSAAVKYAKATGNEEDPAALAAAHYLSQ